jgi:hypothetical protein
MPSTATLEDIKAYQLKIECVCSKQCLLKGFMVVS